MFEPGCTDRIKLGLIVLLQLVYVFTTQSALRLLLPYRTQTLPSADGSPRLAADLDVVMGSEVSISSR